MYRFIDYKKIFEQEQTGAPAVANQPTQPATVTGKTAQIIVSLNTEDLEKLSTILHGTEAAVFTLPARLVSKSNSDEDILLPGMTSADHIFIAFAIASAETNGTPTYPSANLTGANAAKTLVFNVLPKQLAGIENIDSGAVSLSLNTKAGDPSSAIGITLIKNNTEAPNSTESSPETATQTETETAPEAQSNITPDQAEQIAATGEMTSGANPRAIKSFDEFVVHEAKKNWIADVDMKKGELKKSVGKKKITKEVITKEEAKLKTKDKDKKKPGLQLNKKDAKKHKELILAKTLMKASGAIAESKEGRIKGAKDQLVKLHEIIEKMIEETSNKNNKPE